MQIYKLFSFLPTFSFNKKRLTNITKNHSWEKIIPNETCIHVIWIEIFARKLGGSYSISSPNLVNWISVQFIKKREKKKRKKT